MARLYLHPTTQSGVNTVRIVQSNIPQTLKWNKGEMWNHFLHNLGLSASPTKLKQPITFVIWPETAVMADIGQSPNLMHYFATNLPKGSTALIGTLRDVDGQFYNSVTVLDKNMKVAGNYNKHHLVPFGEYVPFRQYLNMTPIGNRVANIGDFTRGSGVTTLHIDTPQQLGRSGPDLNSGAALPAPSPLICYEGIFPGEVARRDDRPDWLVNVTNDAWYGKTAGPHQHFQSARVRAIEEGLPLVRAANTGISATVDPLGRIIGLLPLGKTGVVDTILPAPMPPTLYARFGDTLFFLMLALLALCGETLRRRR